MRIAHITSYYITSTLYKNLYNELDKQGIEQLIYIPVKTDVDIEKKVDFNSKKAEYIYSNCFNFLDRFLYYNKINKITKDIELKIDFQKIDLMHAHSLFVNGGVACKLKKKKNIDYIVAVRNTDLNKFFKYAFHLRNRGVEILREAKKIIFISPAYKNKLIKKYIPNNLEEQIERKSVVVPNGINNFWLNNKLDEKRIKNLNKEVNLMYAGKFNKNKNVETIIEVAKKLNEKEYNVKLRLIGKGKREKKIKRLAKKNEEIVKVYDYMSKEELIKMYRKSDIFIMPSYNETFGLVYIEAMSQGLPIIYSKNEGVDGYFKGGKVGFKVDPNNIQEITNKVELIIADYKKKSSAALKTIKRFSWQRIAKKYTDIYNSDDQF